MIERSLYRSDIAITDIPLYLIEYVFKRNKLTVIELKDGTQIEFDPKDMDRKLRSPGYCSAEKEKAKKLFVYLVENVPHEPCERNLIEGAKYAD